MRRFFQPKDILPRVLKKLGIAEQAEAALVLESALKIFKNNSFEAKPFRFKEGVLFVRVKSGGEASEILISERDLIKKINQRIKKNLVKKIKTKVSF